MNHHGHNNEGPLAILTGLLTGAAGWLLHVNWLPIVGLLISAGWLVIGAVRLRWEWADRRRRPAP